MRPGMLRHLRGLEEGSSDNYEMRTWAGRGHHHAEKRRRRGFLYHLNNEEGGEEVLDQQRCGTGARIARPHTLRDL